MYRIDYYDYPVYDDQLQELFPVLDARLNLEVNDAGTLAFSIPSVHPNFDVLQKLKLGIKVKKEGKMIFKGRIIKDEQSFDNTKKIECEGKMAAFNDTIYRPFEFSGSPSTLFSDLIENHNNMVEDEKKFIVGNITVTDPNDYIVRSSIEYNTTRELLKRLVESLGGHLHLRYEADGDYIDWLADFDYTNTQKIEFGENLLNLTQEVTAEETYTACIPLGARLVINNYDEVDTEKALWEKDKYYTLSGERHMPITTKSEFDAAISGGLTIYAVTSTEETQQRLTVESVNDDMDVIYNEDKVSEYGWKFAPADEVTWDDVTRPENLLNKARAWLNNSGVTLKATLELSAIDLAYADADINSFDWCKYVQVFSLPHNLQKTYLLSEIDIDMLHPENTKITLGDTQYTFHDPFLGQQQIVDGVIDKVNKIEADYATNESVTRAVTQEVVEASSRILQAAEEVTVGILSGYTKASELEAYKKEIENLFRANEDGFAFEFSQLEERITAVGREIVERDQFIRLEAGNIIIGKSDSPVQAKFTNDALEFAYNGQTVARFTNEVLEVRNIAVENQVQYGASWATRPGNYIAGKGYNLDDVWIGG